MVFDGSRLAAIARRLKLLWDERAVVLPGCLLGVYDLGRGLCRALVFDADAAASELKRAVAALDRTSRATRWCWGIGCTARRRSSRPCMSTAAGGWCDATNSWACASCSASASAACQGGLLEDWLVRAGSGVSAPDADPALHPLAPRGHPL